MLRGDMKSRRDKNGKHHRLFRRHGSFGEGVSPELVQRCENGIIGGVRPCCSPAFSRAVALPRPRTAFRAGLLVLLWLAGAGLACASSSDWLVHWWQSDEGLPDNSVSGLAQTPDGYLWVATAGGLLRFDGVRFQEVPVLKLDGVVNHVVRAMTLDRAGRLWLGMDRGPILCLESRGAKVFTREVPDARTSTLAGEESGGGLWAAYTDGGLIHLDEQGKVRVAEPGIAPPSTVSCRVLRGKGDLWYARERTVGVIRDGKLQPVIEMPSTVACIGRRRAGGVWLTTGEQLLHCDGAGQKAVVYATLSPEIRVGQVTALLEDRSGAVWVGTSTAGLFRYSGKEVESISTSHRELTCLLEDAEGNIWAGTAGGGLNRIRRRMVELIGPAAGLPFESVRSVCEDSQGSFWATMEDGSLARLHEGRWENVSKEPDWPGGHAVCVITDEAGRLWMGTRERGLWSRENGKWRGWHAAEGLASESMRSLLVASNGVLWLTTDSPSRVQRLQGDEFHTIELGSRTRSLRAMAEDAAGDLWVGSADGQLFHIHHDQAVNETTNLSTRLLSIRSLCATPDGAVWIGYAGWGLGYLQGNHFTRVTTEAGLYDDYVSQIVPDGQGWLWCAGNRGIFQVRLDDLRAVAEGRAERVRCTVHGRDEDLRSLQPTYENVPGAIRSRDGRIWFPMRTGLTVVNTGVLPHNDRPPPVWLERVTADGQAVAAYDGASPLRVGATNSVLDLHAAHPTLRIGPAHRKLELEFTALSFTAPENVHFQRRLEGFDEDWVDTDARQAAYPPLPAGSYHFLVRACNNDGVWSQQPAELNIIVLPYFYETWWFGATLLTLFTASVIAVVRYVSFRRLRGQLLRLEQQAALHHERTRIARDIHDDLGASLTQIALLGELAQQDSASPSKAAERMQKISSTARQTIKSLDEIVWAVNPRNDTLAHLLDYAGQFALDYLRVAGIRCRLDFPEILSDREISTDIRHNLFLAVKESLHNIVKHAHASEVRLGAALEPKVLRITIEDNGRGFEAAPENALADGLRNLNQRLTEIGGSCRVESHLETGTIVTFEVPLSGRENEK